jgi:hypothetical protein
MDNQTIMLVENDYTKGILIVILFDLYTLDKITEMPVNVVKSEIADSKGYDKINDQYSPEYADECPTARDFPKISCWSNEDNSENILVGVGAAPDSKCIYEFRIYDSQTGKISGTFKRQSHQDVCSGKMIEAEYHQDNRDKIILIFSSSPEYTIVEADIMKDEVDVQTSIISNDLSKIKVAEDLSYVYVVARDFDENNHKWDLNLFTVEYGSDLDLVDDAPRSVKQLGVWIHGIQIIKNYLIVYFEK